MAWLRNLRIKTKLYLVIAVILFDVAIILSVGTFALNNFSAMRAYVGGEGLWAKAQKTAVFSLTKYAFTKDERDYREYQAALQIPLADGRARLAMAQRPEPDWEAAMRGFIDGGNHPEDVRGMTLLFWRFGDVDVIRHCIEVWGEAESRLRELQLVAEGLHGSIRSRRDTPKTIEATLAKIEAINEELTVLENDFSSSLGHASRLAKRILVGFILIGTLIAAFLSFGIALWAGRHIVTGIEKISQAASQAARGDLSARVVVDSKDELGELAQAFNEMTEGLGKLDRLKSEFIATVSHELRTPLSLTLAPVESLLAGEFGQLSDKQRNALQITHNNSIRLLQMITGLLDASRVDAAKTEVNREPTDVLRLTESMVGDFQPMANGKAISCSLSKLEPILPVDIDRYLYERILFNLLSNAIKFTKGPGQVVVTLTQQGERLTLKITDTGIGIAAHELRNLFQRFHQVDSVSTRRFEGTGLGLSLVREFSALLGGTVSVESEPGKGSSFIVEIVAPVAHTVAKLEKFATRAPIQKYFNPMPADLPKASTQARARILVAEDNPELASYLADMLRARYEVRIAEDGQLAFDVAQEWLPDLILSDVMMPLKDGITLCRELKSNAKTASIPVILLTALTDRDALTRGWDAGADEYLFKPFHPAELNSRVNSLLSTVQERKRSEKERHRRELLEIANRDLESFAYVASHDLQEPLRMIANCVGLLQAQYTDQLDPKAKELVGYSIEGANRLRRLVDDLLECSKVASASEASFRDVVDCETCLEEVLANLSAKINETHASITHSTLPKLRGNRSQIIRLLQNLVSNSLKFHGVEAPRIHIGARKEGEDWILAIEDEGIGISPQYADKIFGMFKRLHTRDEYPGSGIGLTVCKRIMDNHCGAIWVESEVGQGSRFLMRFPSTLSV